MSSKTTAFIVGNGVSRKPIDLHGLKTRGEIYGCNAIHREFSDCDYIVAIDDGMIKELTEEIHPRSQIIIPPEDERWESAKYNSRRRRSNAGMNAMLEAIRRDNTKLYCLGFDFLLKGSISTDNVFKNTPNYGIETHAVESDNYYRIKYLEWFMRDNAQVQFTFVLPNASEFATLDASNVSGIFVEDFKKDFDC